MFVVQRTFRRVRRGYDPDEVDRHLELVSRWFTSTEVGQALTRERSVLEQRERELERDLEGARLEADATLEGARRRAEADRAEAARIRADAERERAELPGRVRAELQDERELIIREALEEAEREAAEAAARARAAAEEELEAYVARRRREADRLVEAARREKGS
jgi:DivIVA domain-containing protein